MYQSCRMLFIIALRASSWQFFHLCIFNCQVSQCKHSLDPPYTFSFYFFPRFSGFLFFPLFLFPLFKQQYVSEGRGPGHRQVSQSPGNGMGEKTLTVCLRPAGVCWCSESFGSQGSGSEFRSGPCREVAMQGQDREGTKTSGFLK